MHQISEQAAHKRKNHPGKERKRSHRTAGIARFEGDGVKALPCNQEVAAMDASAAMLVHEMSNCLSVIAFTTQLMEQQMAKRKNAKKDEMFLLVPSLKRGVNELGCLLNEFRSLGLPRRLKLEPTNLIRLLAEILRSVEDQYAIQGIEVRLNAPSQLPSLALDQQKLKQALLNLFKNAVEAMPEGGKLAVRVYRLRRTAVVEIQDTGVGISENMNVFELFHTTKPQGTGLGMAVVRQVIEAHGGAVTYSSRQGKGTTFRVSLPVSTSKDNTKGYLTVACAI
jgi:signal transduction histidine kinase